MWFGVPGHERRAAFLCGAAGYAVGAALGEDGLMHSRGDFLETKLWQLWQSTGGGWVKFFGMGWSWMGSDGLLKGSSNFGCFFS